VLTVQHTKAWQASDAPQHVADAIINAQHLPTKLHFQEERQATNTIGQYLQHINLVTSSLR
jgi:hypothetical protein